MKRFRKGLVAGLLSIIISLSAVMPSFAMTSGLDDPYHTLQYMDDGTLFDPIYYMMTYPDIEANYSGKNAGPNCINIYNHYINYGKAEGRLPYAPGYRSAWDFKPEYLLTPNARKYAGVYKSLTQNLYLSFDADDTYVYLTFNNGNTETYRFDHTRPTYPSEKVYDGFSEHGTMVRRIIFNDTYATVIENNGAVSSWFKVR